MAIDGYITTDVGFCTALCYTYGIEVLERVTTESDGHRQLKQFHLALASEDCKILMNDWNLGSFAVSNLKAYAKLASTVHQLLRDMTKRQETEWSKPEVWEIVPKKGRK